MRKPVIFEPVNTNIMNLQNMIRPGDTSINIDGTDYDIVVIDGGIQLQSLHRTLVIEGGADDLKSEIEAYFNTCQYENGRPVSYRKDDVSEQFNQVLAQWSYDHRESATILTHNLN